MSHRLSAIFNLADDLCLCCSSAFFWGYAMTQVPGGYIAGK